MDETLTDETTGPGKRTRERETRKPLYNCIGVYTHQPEEKGMPKYNFYVPESFEKELEEFVKKTKADQLSPSRVIISLIKRWLLDHSGNPQTLLTSEPRYIPPYQYSLPPVLIRRQLIKDLEKTIEANPKVPIDAVLARFAVESGLREETIVGYMKTLKRARKL